MARRPYTVTQRKLADGTVRRYYYHAISRQPIDSEPGRKDWDAKLAAAGGREVRTPEGTVGWLIEQYRRHQWYQMLAPATKLVYERAWKSLAPIETAQVADVKRRHIAAIYDRLAGKVGLANQFLSAVGALWRLAIRLELSETKLTAGFERIEGGHWDEWEEEWIARFAANIDKVPPAMAVAFHLGLYTGMREGDICRATWHQFDGRVIRYTPGKTRRKVGMELAIPCHPDLQAALTRARSATSSIFMVPAARGGRLAESHFRHQWSIATKAAGVEHRPFHGSRKAAVIRLVHAGCSPHEVSAITGHSLQMVILYSRGVVQQQLAEEAIGKLTAARKRNKT